MMDSPEDGRVGDAEQALVSDQAASRLDPSGFDPSRIDCEQMLPDDEGWSEFVHPQPGYKIQCCDCGLIHDMEFAIVPNAGWPTRFNHGEGEAGVIQFRARRSDAQPGWVSSRAVGLEGAIAQFKAELPGWWYSVGECQVSCDASCGPTRESPDIALVEAGNCFDCGFHVELPQPSSLSEALRNVMEQAVAALRDSDEHLKGENAKRLSGDSHASADPQGIAQGPTP